MTKPDRISIEDVKRRLDAGEHIAFLDTRSAEAWAKSDLQIPGSMRVPPDHIDQHLNEIPRKGLIVTYCT
jgi:rhodanese-related sulfurtransferase